MNIEAMNVDKFKKYKFIHWLHTDGGVGGQERFTMFIHGKMLEFGLDSELVFTDGPGRVEYARRVLKNKDIVTKEMSIGEMLRYIRKQNADYILHYSNTAMPYIMWSKLLHPRGIHHRYFGHGFSNKRDPWHGFIYSFIDKYFFPTKLTLERGYRNLFKPAKKKIFQYFGVEIPQRKKDPSQFRASGKTVITSLSRLDPGKGLLEFVNAFVTYFKSNPSAKSEFDIQIYGHANPTHPEDVKLEQDLKDIIAANNLQGIVRLMGHTDRPMDVLLESDFLIFASPDEYYGIAILEALATGVPPIAVPTGSFVELNSTDYGFFIDLYNPEQFKKDIEKIKSLSKEEYKKLSINSRKVAEEKFDINKTTLEYLENIVR